MAGKNKLKIAISGDVALDKTLREIAAEDGPRSINNAMRKALREAVKTIVFPAVVANLRRNNNTGLLMSQLRVRAGKRSRNKIRISVGFPDPLFQGDTYYAGFIEFGTKERTVKSTGQHVGRVVADSFLRAALYPNTGKILALVRQRMAEFIATMNSQAA